MTDMTFSRLPLAAGGAVAASLGRAGLWTLSRYMRAPLASTGLLALVTLMALAASNALYFQTSRHPAPLFALTSDMPATVPDSGHEVVPVLPQLRPQTEPQFRQVVAPQTTSSVPETPVIPDAPVGNTQVFQLQKKLTELGLFEGDVDGFYGPMTAKAIRAFERSNGLTPTGALSPTITDAILAADAIGMMPSETPVATLALQPMPTVPVRLPPLAPVENTGARVSNATAQTIDSIIAAVQGNRVDTATPTLPSAPVQHVAEVEASAPQPAVIVPQQAVPQPVPQQVAIVQLSGNPANNTQLIEHVQRGLASLGFLQGPIDGKAGEATAKAIRSFEIFHNYAPTGEVNGQLLDMLVDAGASV